MSPPERPSHFSTFRPTSYILLRQAQTDQQARAELIRRYGGVARRYLGGALRDEPDSQAAVDECFQRFSLRMMEGAYLRDESGRGRFRDFLRVCLCNLVHDYRREKARSPAPLSPGIDVAAPELPLSDAEYGEMWNDGVMQRALEALRLREQQTGQVLYSVLKLRMDHPEARAEELAAMLAERWARPVNAEAVRKSLSRARNSLREQLREEVRLDQDDPTAEKVEQELADLGLLQYVRPGGLSRRGTKSR
jgi:DNA-directed RNA polymerase specialized sigma24 family protein